VGAIMRGIILIVAGATAVLVALAGDGAGHARVAATASLEGTAGAGTSAELRFRP
jgi:hypothetical protein